MTKAQSSWIAGELGGQPVDVVVRAVDGDQRVAVHGRRHDLLLLEVAGYEDVRLDAGAGGGGGNGVGEVARGRTGQHGEAELAGGGERHGDDAVLERVRGVDRVVLDPQGAHAELSGEVVGADQAGEAGLGVGGVGDVGRNRQQVLVAPDVARTCLDAGPRDGAEVVRHLQRPEALEARIERPELRPGSALTT